MLICNAWSLTVTENVVAVAKNFVGVPDISPVLAEKLSPAGKVAAGESVYVNIPYPPDAVTGINGVTTSY